MSKYTDVGERLICYLVECSMWCRENHLTETFETAVEALEIADRLEQADADVYNKCCEVCTSLTTCKERGEVCDEASAWEDGYSQALTDIRGDNNDE